ncbi:MULTISPECIES: cardiolipin synthase [unclassified Ruegeria]|uniref:cardiolipin synthase n=1 Tax=unclassified Ruegeria TaxID=2625375 RepID=UPI001492F88B|nr:MULTISPECIES: cardiolipin synthase [unclassified Ruegeria]NOD34839.1 cardiolipin synthase [Ruegeria sp. HKCCD7296]NOE41689.1 cardiolipin synthase [Ruegeria sp. HKCCD7319]
MSGEIIVVVIILLEMVAIYCAVLAVRHARTPQGSVAWVVFLITAPYIAVPTFLFLGSFHYEGYLTGRRDSDEVISGLEGFKQQFPPTRTENQSIYRALEKIGDIPVGSGSDLDLLIDGEATFTSIFEAIASAKSYVLVQSYIINDDKIGRHLRDVLLDRVQDGVSVRLIYDAVGCAKLPKTYLQSLSNGGVQVVNAHAYGGPKSRFQINFRNHRKTVVVDGEVGFTGGLNMGDEYMGEDPKFGSWRDTHARLTGPIVLQLQLIFAEDWHWATRENLISELDWDVKKTEADKDAVIIATGPGDAFDTGSFYFCTLINAATERLWIASPYFVPENDILTALKLAAMRGVDVKLLTPEVVDHTIPWLAALAYFDEVMDAGVEVWRYNDGFMHQKVVLVDDMISSVGTTNLDNRSCRLNFEETAVVFDEQTASEVATMFEADFARSFLLKERLADRGFKQRHGAPLARLFSPLL